MTVPEFYELKYTRGVRLLGGIILALAGTLNMGLFPILGSKFVVGFTGLDKEYVNYVMIGMLLIVVFYTLMGGMVSVVLTDFAQFVLLSLGFFFGTYVILNHPELGWDNLVQTVQVHKGDIGFDPIANPDYGISMISFLFFVGLVGVVWQPEMMRPLSAESPKVARRVFWIAAGTVHGAGRWCRCFGASRRWPILATPGRTPITPCPKCSAKSCPLASPACSWPGCSPPSCPPTTATCWPGAASSSATWYHRSKPCSPSRVASARQTATWGGLSSEREIYWTRAIVVILAAFLAIFGALYQLPETAFRFMYVTGTIYFCRLRRHCRLGIVLEKGQYPGCVLCPDTGRTGATQLPNYERKPALGARVFYCRWSKTPTSSELPA